MPCFAQVDDALRAGTDVVLRIDVQGAATVKRLIPDAITIFVAAEDEPTLVKRLVERKTETVDKLAVRVATARSEMESVKEFDYGTEKHTHTHTHIHKQRNVHAECKMVDTKSTRRQGSDRRCRKAF